MNNKKEFGKKGMVLLVGGGEGGGDNEKSKGFFKSIELKGGVQK